MKGTAYLVQGALVSLWWLGLAVSDVFYEAFQFPGISKTAFNAFLIPDMFVIVVLSVLRAYKPRRELEFIILGGFAFGSLYCLNASILTSGGYLPTTLMLLGLCYNLFLVFQSEVFRESKSASRFQNGFKTFVQIVSIWSVTLVLFPWIILEAFGYETPTSVTLKIIAILLFVLASTFNLASAHVFVKHGDGTPLPADQTKKLVIAGPYKYVRNPMALTGIVQGAAVALYFASLPVLVYALLGGILWHIVVRPLEEKNMLKRFGEDYENYRKEVGLWVPRTKLFKS
ncbi:MAG: isoprenylcysteine carboxylmethyltransferase family protein [Bacteroidota bacterium]